MSWPIPEPGAIAERYAVGFETAFALDPVTGLPRIQTVDARSPNTALRALGVVGEETWTELYLYQQSLAGELMIDTAQDWLPRHAATWGVPQLQPLTALGNLIFSGAPGTVLPQGIEVYAGVLRWRTSAAATIPAASSPGMVAAVSIPAEAEIAGTASNIAGGTVLPVVSPIAGLSPQSAVVDPVGFNGGRDVETTEAWRLRILRRVRQRGQAGSEADYLGWAEDAGASAVQVLPRWIGPGTVGLALLMPGPRVPSAAELARIDAAIQVVRPVTATVVTLAGTLTPTDITLAIAPDTVATRAAVVAAIAAFFAREAAIGVTLPRSRLDEAISSATGEFDHLIAAPAGDIVPGRTALPTVGAVTFTSGAGLPQPPMGG